SAFFNTTREEARRTLGVAAGERVIVIAGATQGAHAINEAVFKGLRTLVETMSVFHVTGTADYDDAAGYKSGLGEGLDAKYHVSAFREDLPTVMLAADLAVMRAGASVLGELPAAALPAILVPATYAGGHQRHNAAWLSQAGAAVIVEEANLAHLIDRVLSLVEDEALLASMRAAAHSLSRTDAAATIAAVIEGVAKR
ncbi:MAG: glycosyltransferase, partial [Anaerolineaceae bacterium]